MQSIIDAIEQWLKDFLIGAITGNLSSMFSDVNSKVATIATEVGKTPESWNSSVFSIILTLSKNVVVPIAGLVIAAVLTYELISMIIEKNNMHDIDTFMFFKWAFKSAAAAIIVNHTFDFIMQNVRNCFPNNIPPNYCIADKEYSHLHIFGEMEQTACKEQHRRHKDACKQMLLFSCHKLSSPFMKTPATRDGSRWMAFITP